MTSITIPDDWGGNNALAPKSAGYWIASAHWGNIHNRCLKKDLEDYIPLGFLRFSDLPKILEILITKGDTWWVKNLDKIADTITRTGIGSTSRVYLISLLRATAAWSRGEEPAWPEL